MDVNEPRRGGGNLLEILADAMLDAPSETLDFTLRETGIDPDAARDRVHRLVGQYVDADQSRQKNDRAFRLADKLGPLQQLFRAGRLDPSVFLIGPVPVYRDQATEAAPAEVEDPCESAARCFAESLERIDDDFKLRDIKRDISEGDRSIRILLVDENDTVCEELCVCVPEGAQSIRAWLLCLPSGLMHGVEVTSDTIRVRWDKTEEAVFYCLTHSAGQAATTTPVLPLRRDHQSE